MGKKRVKQDEHLQKEPELADVLLTWKKIGGIN
jgi:hypothetical protein